MQRGSFIIKNMDDMLRAREFILGELKISNFRNENIEKIKYILHEILLAMIREREKENRSGDIIVEYEISDKKVVIDIMDPEGKPLKLDSVDLSREKTFYEARAGILIIKQFADSFSYDIKYNKIRIVKYNV